MDMFCRDDRAVEFKIAGGAGVFGNDDLEAEISGSTGGGGGAAAPAAEEKSEFDVVMTAFGEKKLDVVKVVKNITGQSLMDAKKLVEAPPATIKQGETGLAFAAPIAAYSATQRDTNGFNALFRFGVIPLFLFSGTFFPLEQLPDHLIKAVLATEDRRFYEHFGIDLQGLLRAVVVNAQADQVVQGVAGEDLRDQAHAMVLVKLASVARHNAGTLLAAVLEGVQAAVRQLRRIRVTVNSENAAVMFRVVLHEVLYPIHLKKARTKARRAFVQIV